MSISKISISNLSTLVPACHFVVSDTQINICLQIKNNATLVGFAYLYTNPYHPYCDELYLYIFPRFRRQRFGSHLFKAILSHATQPIKVSVMSGNPAIEQFLTSHHFTLKRRCWEYSVDKKLLLPCQAIPITLTAFIDITEPQRMTLHQLLYRDYHIAHKNVSPMSEKIPLQDWISLFLNDCEQNHSFIMEYQGKMGYVTAHNTTENTIDIGYIGGNLDADIFQNFVVNITQYYLNHFSTLNLEIDDVNSHAMVLHQLFRYNNLESYNTYIKD